MLSARLDRLRSDTPDGEGLSSGIRTAVIAASVILVTLPLASYAAILGIVR
jgi:hypothetical protein